MSSTKWFAVSAVCSIAGLFDLSIPDGAFRYLVLALLAAIVGFIVKQDEWL